MAVHNGGELLRESLDGILAQKGVDLELVVVDDGSTDSTATVLRSYARSVSNLTLISKAHEGLTRALIDGCRAASAPVIARHDAKDYSDPMRLRMQLDILESRPDVNVVSSWVQYRGPGGEDLGRLDTGEGTVTGPDFHGGSKGGQFPYHGSAMFRRKDYEDAGGYRTQFYFAQDIDLWLRLKETGAHFVIPRLLYTARVDVDSISGRFREEQDLLTRIAISATLARNKGRSEHELLRLAANVSRCEKRFRKRRNIARSSYFLGCLLHDKGKSGARQYFLRALRSNPIHLKSWYRLILSMRIQENPPYQG